MVKSLQAIFRQQDSSIGLPVKTGGNVKLLRSPYNARERRVVPSYIDDIVWQDAKKESDVDVSKITSSNWNWERFNNIIIKKKNKVSVAVPEYDPARKQVKEI